MIKTSDISEDAAIDSVGHGIGLTHMAVHASLQRMKTTIPRVVWKLAGVFSFEIDTKATAVESNVAKGLGWKVFQCGDASGLLQFVEKNASNWQQSKVLLLTRLPKPKLKFGEVPAQGSTVLHKDGLRLIWSILASIQHLAAQDKSAVLHLCDISPVASTSDEAAMSSMFGTAFHGPVGHYGATNKLHYWRTNIKTNKFKIEHQYEKMPLDSPQDGWVWQPEQGTQAAADGRTTMTSAPGADIVSAAANAVFDFNSLPVEYQQHLLTQRMEHVSSKEQRMLSVTHWLFLLGLRNTVLEQAVKEKFPCFGKMVKVTGMPCPQDLAAGVPCGTQRWCNHCEAALGLIGKCPHVPLMTDILVAMLQSCGEAWISGDKALWMPCPSQERHVCGSTCPLA